ncbi:hypothetical protein LL912_11995 [Niabella sp. CC-SYL272]|uniref:hypothetical protein n=1 Tax=Niabella agricola TaxID=2891571 RepID=UPI001F3BF42B|nr:hypothetical protein [Niabella agricola]MCF3109494.1 hypothetical protein [Niabella agricola]
MKLRFLCFFIGLLAALTGTAQNDTIPNAGDDNLIWDLDITYAANGSKLLEIKVYDNEDSIPVYTKYVTIKDDNDEVAVLDYLRMGAAFGRIAATAANGRLMVSWQTVTEENSKEFVVEGSADGQQWEALGTIQSKSSNGSSAESLEYGLQLKLPVSFAAIGMGGLLLLTVTRSRRTKLLMIAAVVLVVGACRKKDQMATAGTGKTEYVRIAQHEKDGAIGYSKAVKVTYN